MPRSIQRQLQDVWICDATESLVGIDTVKTYSKPVKHRWSVSATSGSLYGLGSGWKLDYDRYITSYDRDEIPDEGQLAFIDITPELDDDGYLVLEEIDGVMQPKTPPDYMIKQIMNTKKGTVARFGLKKV